MRIAAEEAWAPAEILARYRKLLEEKPACWDPGFRSLWGFFLGDSARATQLVARIQDLGAQRLADMDGCGIAKQIVFLTAPGVQVFDGGTAVPLAKDLNDQLSQAIKKHPDRYAGLAAIAPQDPRNAVKELQRSIGLGMKGAVINSHTQGEYLDEPKCWEIFEAAEALGVPIYLHPNTPPPAMIGPFLPRGLDGAIYGFAVETALHLLRIIVAGVFDRFPKLKIVVGHLGEGLPYSIWRVDNRNAWTKAKPNYKAKRKIGEYFQQHFWLTTSGNFRTQTLIDAILEIGADHILFSTDWPFENVDHAADWFDAASISEADRLKIGRLNALRLFKLDGAASQSAASAAKAQRVAAR
jgi:2,3-dihydroxybenzoate decarboxylase